MNPAPIAIDVASHLPSQRRALVLAALAVTVGLAIGFFRHTLDGEWNQVYARAAQRMEAGESIHYEEPNAYAYPPLMALLTIPLTKLGLHGGLTAWYLINLAAVTVLAQGAWSLAGGPPIGRWDRRWKLACGLAALLAARFCAAPFENQQFDVVIAALAMLGCTALAEDRPMAAACWLGASAAMKCTPLLFAPYLLWRGRLRAAAVMVLAAVGLNRLPELLYPQRSGGSYLAEWIHTFLGTVGREAPGTWYSDLLLNQSLAGLWSRYVQIGWPLSTSQLPSGPLVPSAEATALLRWLVYGSLTLLAAAAAWRMWPPGWPTCLPASADSASSSAAARAGRSLARQRLAWEMAICLCLMLLASPMSSKAHYVVLVLPCLLVARSIVESGGWHRWLLATALVCLGPLSSGDITGDALGDLVLAWGGPTWFVLLLFGVLWWKLPAWPRHCSSPQPAGEG